MNAHPWLKDVHTGAHLTKWRRKLHSFTPGHSLSSTLKCLRSEFSAAHTWADITLEQIRGRAQRPQGGCSQQGLMSSHSLPPGKQCIHYCTPHPPTESSQQVPWTLAQHISKLKGDETSHLENGFFCLCLCLFKKGAKWHFKHQNLWACESNSTGSICSFLLIWLLTVTSMVPTPHFFFL